MHAHRGANGCGRHLPDGIAWLGGAALIVTLPLVVGVLVAGTSGAGLDPLSLLGAEWAPLRGLFGPLPLVAGGDAAFAFRLAEDPRAFERAFLVYELEGVSHWTFVPRALNVRDGPPPRPTAEMGEDPGLGGLQVEELSPAWLRRGENALQFRRRGHRESRRGPAELGERAARRGLLGDTVRPPCPASGPGV